MTMTVEQYNKIKAELKEVQERELAARLQLVERSGHTKIGSKTVAMDGFKIAVQNTQNITLYEPSLEEVREKLDNNELFDAVFKIKREYSVTGAKVLTDEQREIIADALIIKPGLPQLKITAPNSPD